jgi:5'-3' exonuclease
LPFVEEKRLFKALEPYYEVLTTAESKYELLWYKHECKNVDFILAKQN